MLFAPEPSKLASLLWLRLINRAVIATSGVVKVQAVNIAELKNNLSAYVESGAGIRACRMTVNVPPL
jgi:hypothetical protein